MKSLIPSLGFVWVILIDKHTFSPFSKGVRNRVRHRDRIDIFSQILEAANGSDARKLKMMYKAKINYDQLREYLRVLTKNELLSYDLDTQTFKTTEKGLRFLDAYNKIGDVINILQ
jgi:predicted transcriptional regulator